MKRNHVRAIKSQIRALLIILPDAFEDFLTSFKSSASASESSATNALQDLNIDEDGLSDEYDFMDDIADGNGRQTNRRTGKDRDPKEKYMEMLQRVADRHTSEVIIELDDLDAVGSPAIAEYWRRCSMLTFRNTVREESRR